MLRAERESVLNGTEAGELPDEVSRSLMAMLDVEESHPGPDRARATTPWSGSRT